MKSKKNWKPVVFTLLALATIPVAVVYTNYAISNQPEPEQQHENVNIPRVSIIPTTAGTYKNVISSFGEVKAVDEIDLSSQISGRVIWRNPEFMNGNPVRKGDVLLRFDNIDYQAALSSAEQALAESSLTLQQEERQKRQAERDWKRSGLKDKPSALLLREPQLKVAKAGYKAAKAAVSQAKRDLQQTRLRAPFNGIILNRTATQGSYVESGTVVARLRNSDQAEISIGLSAAQWKHLPENPAGLPVTLYSRDTDNAQWQGVVQRIDASINQTTRLRNLIITVEKPVEQTPPLLFGSFIKAEITGPAIDNLFALPAAALTADGYIWTVVENNILQRIATKPLFSRGGMHYIARNQLPEQIRLVQKPLSSYLPNMQVTPHVRGGVQ